MTPQHLTSLELSQRLKELGVPQRSEFYHFKGKILMDWEMRGMTMTEESVPVSAYLSSELMEMFPPVINHPDNNEKILWFSFGKSIVTEPGDTKYNVTYAHEDESFTRIDEYGDNPADVCAKILIRLLENKLLTLEKGGEV